MKKHSLFIGTGLITSAIVSAVAWYLASPLFINRTVDEAFPLAASNQDAQAQISGVEVEPVKTNPEESRPSQEGLEKMAEVEPQAVAPPEVEAGEAMADKMMDEAIPADQPTLLAQGSFKDADSFHKGSGTATLFQLPDGAVVLRFEEFSATNGPDLHVLLAENPAPTHSSELGPYLDLGSLKGNIGNQNYEIPAGTDLSQYHSVVIYCQPFHVIFATAALN